MRRKKQAPTGSKIPGATSALVGSLSSLCSQVSLNLHFAGRYSEIVKTFGSVILRQLLAKPSRLDPDGRVLLGIVGRWLAQTLNRDDIFLELVCFASRHFFSEIGQQFTKNFYCQ